MLEDSSEDSLDVFPPLLSVSRLQAENQQLRQQLQDLETLLQITLEQGTAVEAGLQTANKQMAIEVRKRQRAEFRLKRLAAAISRRNLDLEIILDTLREHGDAIHDQWQAKVQEAKQLAEVDSLTQIPNRRRFDAHIFEQWQQMAQQQQPLSVILCDVDFFKQYNDTYGHLLGDQCLQQVAASLCSTLSHDGDLIARYGGEEFAAILPNTSLEAAMAMAQKIQARVEQMLLPHAQSPISPCLTLSLGVASLVPRLDQSPQILVDAADRALYLAKQTGRILSRGFRA